MEFFIEIEIFLILAVNKLRTLNRQKTLRKKNTPRGIFLFDFKLRHGAVVTTAVRNWHKHKHTDYRNRIESPEINPHVCGQLVHDNQPPKMRRIKDSPLKKQ